jgi:N-acetylated-alpha-linked acidic dipeptidase
MIYCLWDGEEPGLLGSTEWVETHAAELSQKAVAYVNTDSNGRGFFNVGGSHSLERFINQVERGVTDPETHLSLAERARDQKLVSASPDERKELRTKVDMAIGALGSGSDYSSFLQHLGIAAFDMGFGGESGGGVYHSTYDSYDWYTRFGDTTFVYGVALAQVAGRTMMRLADADVLPFDFTHLSDTIDKYAVELPKLVDKMREDTVELNREIKEGTLFASYDPSKPKVLPKVKGDVPPFDFTVLTKALARLKTVAKAYDGVADAATASTSLDAALMETERTLLGEGLPRRPWYRHMIYAPGFYTGYGVKTLPSIREAIEQRDWSEANAEIPKVAATIDRLSNAIEKAVAAAS